MLISLLLFSIVLSCFEYKTEFFYKTYKSWWINTHPKFVELDEYVYQATKNRPESHGYIHMRFVVERRLDWYINEDKHILLDICLLAWIHDVLDHKYDDVNKQDFNNAMKKIGISKNIVDLAPLISFSAEKKKR